MEFDYGESPFISFGDGSDGTNRIHPRIDQAAQEYRRIIGQIDRQARQANIEEARLQEFFYMSAVFACKALLYFLLQDAYEHGFYSANL